MEEKRQSSGYRIIEWLVKLFYRRPEFSGTENLTDGPSIIVGNHTQMNGPIIGALYVPGKSYVWCAHEMMEREEVAEYAFTDFWSFKPKFIQPFFRLASHLIVPISVCVFNNARTIPVYRDARTIKTFRTTIQRMQEGNNIIIFPEYNKRYNNILYDFQDKFIDTARFYYKKTGMEASFVPMYIAPTLHRVAFGEPVRFDPAAPIKEERERIKNLMMERITALALDLPEHKVVPYRNIGRRNYPKNIPLEVFHDEETDI